MRKSAPQQSVIVFDADFVGITAELCSAIAELRQLRQYAPCAPSNPLRKCEKGT
jgi:hypothetical protein